MTLKIHVIEYCSFKLYPLLSKNMKVLKGLYHKRFRSLCPQQVGHIANQYEGYQTMNGTKHF